MPQSSQLRLNSWEGVQFCGQTRRIALISPLPERLQQEVGALSAQCLDVMVFHRYDAELLHGLAIDLTIVDCTVAQADAGIVQAGGRVLYLVGGQPHRADSMLQWPQDPKFLLHKVNELLNLSPRSGTPPQSAPQADLQYKGIAVDLSKMKVTLHGRTLSLTKTEYDILIQFLESNGRVISREEILQRLWSTQFTGGSNVVDVHIKSLRKKLGDSAAKPTYIATVRGVGYRLADSE